MTWYLVAFVALSVVVTFTVGAYLKWHVDRHYPVADERRSEEDPT